MGVRLVVSLLLAAVPVLGCGGNGGGPSGPVPGGNVTVNDDYFSPRSVLPDASGNVTWGWSDGNQNLHDVLFPDGEGSQLLQAGSYLRNFSGFAPGIYSYICTIHNGMSGEVVVP